MVLVGTSYLVETAFAENGVRCYHGQVSGEIRKNDGLNESWRLSGNGEIIDFRRPVFRKIMETGIVHV